ncbi:MAG: AMP-binding protein, partial [Parvularculaceae bacterium]|nr:AMP-binding protein [Parvularculaceae bacterium]
MTLYAALRASFPLDRPFLIPPNRPAVAYGEIDALAGAYAGALAAAGAAPGDRIVAQVDKSIENVALYLAALRGGFVYVPLNTAYTPDEVGYFLGDAEPSVF